MAAERSEIAAVEAAHQAAQARLGIGGAYLALADWGAVSATDAAGTSGSWLSRSARLIAALRRRSAKLARAYYQLGRAIDTGHALGLPDYSDDPEAVTMGGLRKQFLDLLVEVAAMDVEPSGDDDVDVKWFESELQNVKVDNSRTGRFALQDLDPFIRELDGLVHDDDGKVIGVDAFIWPDDWTAQEVAAAFGPVLKARAVDRSEEQRHYWITEAETSAEALAKIDKAHQDAGSVGAGVADWAGVQGGRDQIDYAYQRDRRAMAVARGTGPDPCAFCAMLASRGFVYKSKSGATSTTKETTRLGNEGHFETGESVRKFHLNCHCYPIVRWIDAPDVSDLSKKFLADWNRITAAHSGADKLRQYRRWYDRQRPSAKPSPRRTRV